MILKNCLGFLLTILALSFTFSCFNPFSPSSGAPKKSFYNLGANSPVDVLAKLQISYNKQDITLFKSLLSSDFKFAVNITDMTNTDRFKASDIDGDGLLEIYWEKDKEILIHDRMFKEAKSINLSFPIPDSSMSLPWVDPATKETLGIYLEIDNILLDISYNNIFYRVEQSRQKFGIKKSTTDTTLWVIGQWHDEGIN